MQHCSNGHSIGVIAGPCATCARERQANQRRRNAEARTFAKALRELRIPLDVNRIAEGDRLLTALELARNADAEIR